MILEVQRSDLSVAPIDAASAARLAATLLTEADGAIFVVRPGNWSQTHSPAINTQAIASKAAGGAGVRHVCTAISATLVTAAAAQAEVTILLRDGASGAGVSLLAHHIVLPVNSVWSLHLSDLNIVGSPNVAMTFEFSAGPAVGGYQSVNLFGYSAS